MTNLHTREQLKRVWDLTAEFEALAENRNSYPDWSGALLVFDRMGGFTTESWTVVARECDRVLKVAESPALIDWVTRVRELAIELSNLWAGRGMDAEYTQV